MLGLDGAGRAFRKVYINYSQSVNSLMLTAAVLHVFLLVMLSALNPGVLVVSAEGASAGRGTPGWNRFS